MSKPRILIVSKTAWNDNNSFGNTFSNLFSGWEPNNILNIYCDEDLPNTTACKLFYQISEKRLVKSIFNKKKQAGTFFNYDEIEFNKLQKKSEKNNFIIYFIKKTKFQIFIWIRDLIWIIGRWKTKDLVETIKSFDPDILFFPFYTSFYMHRIQQFIVKKTNKKYVYYTSDDGCTFKQFNFSPLFWIDRFIKRFIYRRNINKSEFLYVISNKQKNEYEKIFNKECKVLMKGANFEIKPINQKTNTPLKLSYTGNIGDGRWKSLIEIAKAIEKINKKEITMLLEVYTRTPLTRKMYKAFNKTKGIELMGSASSDAVISIQEAADILVHVESFNLYNKSKVRLSVSTKIVDYFSRNKCILAVGPRNIASIDYLNYYDTAMVVTKKSEVQDILINISKNPTLIAEYASKAWEFGKKHHQIVDVQEQFYNDLFLLSKTHTI